MKFHGNSSYPLRPILEKIAKGEVGKALDDLLEISEFQNPDIFFQTLLFSCRFHTLNKMNNTGSISLPEYWKEFNQITSGLLKFLEGLPGNHPNSLN